MAFKSKATPNVSVLATPTTITDTVASGNTQTIIGLSIANVVTSNITMSIKLNKSGGTSSFVVKDALILPGGALIVVGGDQKVVLEAGDSLTAYASVAASSDAIVSYLV